MTNNEARPPATTVTNEMLDLMQRGVDVAVHGGRKGISVVPCEHAMTIAEAKESFDLLEKIKVELINKNDLEIIEGKAYICKSGWRKIAFVFNISTEMISCAPMSRRSPIAYRATMKAIAPNGRFTFGVGFCTEKEKKAKKVTDSEKARGITQAQKDAKGGWSHHKDHDIMAMAEVRATNRAISDLVGGVEMSAEEVRYKQRVTA